MNWHCTGENQYVIRHYSEPYKDTWNIHLDEHGNVETERKWSLQVLQQKWAKEGFGGLVGFEWRDVPTVKEEK